jgi:hypothetical protein
MSFIVYEVASGRIVSFSAGTADDAAAYETPGYGVITDVGDILAQIHKLHVQSGVLTERPADPGEIEAVKASAIARVNQRAGEIIASQLPHWKQANLTARAIELQSVGAANWNESESQEWADITAAWTWVKSIRAQSNVAVAAIQNSASADEVAQIEQMSFNNQVVDDV